LALLRKKGENPNKESNRVQTKLNKADLEAIQEFFKNVSLDLEDGLIEIKEEKVYFIPRHTSLMKGIRFLRTGLLLGEIKKNRFEPSQALAMALKAEQFKSTISLSQDDVRVIKYLKGETLDVSDISVNCNSGWQLICVDKYPLGWGKLSNGVLKNKYYSGWRWQ